MAKGTIRVGIGGWDFDEWRGTFYPAGLAKARQLSFAAERLTSIEINATYYGSQKPATFASWAKTVPDGFRFAVKASRFATNRKILADGAESVQRFLTQGITELGDRLGPILWQFMATKKFDADDFAGFLALLPPTQDGLPLRHALEVRHESFRDSAFYALARAANAAIVFADDDTFPCIDEGTADFSYARLQHAQADCPTGYDDAALDHWSARARDWATRGDVFAYFISGAKVRNPAAAQAMIAKLA
ncbi:DUF72 domain-containing protein [Sphingomonas sp. SUN039]|uniref:DUF72 domain-containing protein n=1 Tax=Sphingomonas sp. SUN039 TaxID=2937787 RepID=UPI0021649613|nr:DUF72 domain-containing protein [Sphingomonas sp. SUN039]UVO52591.1 DUF72 domain-containing protein [Sphingomonas sp. SUN039]